ncbi:hypothetical protein VT84_13570 [Gemmata sp. SH-PL17]|uniref:hypothetical protein n=1 Tax=Gemmata sp. SH-PL17 TaxID=1630693 RepID=UPI00078CB576|nr:hypothetical protein [Gemmata sp. SH-PL17]AMV25425.1 hypothetical protein VT84_13570 [Gemmata sp. SH-PL17]
MSRGVIHSFNLLPEDLVRLELIRGYLTDLTPWRPITSVEVIRAALQMTADKFAREREETK